MANVVLMGSVPVLPAGPQRQTELNVQHVRPVSFWIRTGTVKFVNWAVNSVPMAPGTALLAHRVSLRTGTTVQSAMPFRKLRQMARLVPMEATALGLLARFVRRFARLVLGRIRTIASFADLALTNLMGHA
jgi:hypothetical protein